ncbi:MAG: LPS assembly lipoprotein LptE [Chromatiales bacterium]|nr:LPS assembly lipoprotein LptE [Chromatiales bacterium]
MRLLLTLLLLSLAGCGFHLRGSEPLPEVMAVSYLALPKGSPLYYELERQLLAAGGRVVDEAGVASATIKVESAQIRSRTLSLDTLGRVSEYGLTLSVRYQLLDADGAAYGERLVTHVERDHRFNADAMLAQGAEREKVELHMYRTAAEQMVRRLRRAAVMAPDLQTESTPESQPAPAAE